MTQLITIVRHYEPNYTSKKHNNRNTYFVRTLKEFKTIVNKSL